MMVALLKNSGPHFRAFEIYREFQGARLGHPIFLIKLIKTCIMQNSLNKDYSTFLEINTTSPIPGGRPLERKRRNSTAIVSSGCLLTDSVHKGALSSVIRWKTYNFPVFPSLLENTRRIFVFSHSQQTQNSRPLLPIPHANWNFRHCDVIRDLADWAGYHPPLELLDQGVGSLGTWQLKISPRACSP